MATVGALDTYRIYDGIDENGIVGTVAPGRFAHEGRCWRMVYENPVGQGGHCMQPVTWVGRWKFLTAGRRCGVVSGTPMSCRGPGGGSSVLVVEILCADCGCLVDRGVRVTVCGDPDCCCAHLAIHKTDDAGEAD